MDKAKPMIEAKANGVRVTAPVEAYEEYLRASEAMKADVPSRPPFTSHR